MFSPQSLVVFQLQAFSRLISTSPSILRLSFLSAFLLYTIPPPPFPPPRSLPPIPLLMRLFQIRYYCPVVLTALAYIGPYTSKTDEQIIFSSRFQKSSTQLNRSKKPDKEREGERPVYLCFLFRFAVILRLFVNPWSPYTAVEDSTPSTSACLDLPAVLNTLRAAYFTSAGQRERRALQLWYGGVQEESIFELADNKSR